MKSSETGCIVLRSELVAVEDFSAPETIPEGCDEKRKIVHI